MKVLLIGNGAREHAIAEALARSQGHQPEIYAYMKANNPGIAEIVKNSGGLVEIGAYDDLHKIVSFAQDHAVRLTVIGPEDPLANGVTDALKQVGIPAVGPTKELAKLETSKAFTREILRRNKIPGNPWYKIFGTGDEKKLMLCLRILYNDGLAFVLKPDGLTSGKGVMVQGDHFQDLAQAEKIALAMLEIYGVVLVEEKLEGEEFSLQCLTDGKTVVATPPVQDHKRRLNGDKGLNTGGMGSYSCANHLLPFLTRRDVNEALLTTYRLAQAIHEETGEYYQGIMYGGFMATADGVRVVEYNARFGDPEAMNVLPLLKTDFVDVCLAIVNGSLNELEVEFQPWHTVVKYAVPVNYGLPPDEQVAVTSDIITIGQSNARYYFSSVNEENGRIKQTSSRAIAALGLGDFLAEAELDAEAGTMAVRGEVAHRSDIGTAELIQKRVRHMQELRGKVAA